MAKIWITGIAGFLGSHLADAMIDMGHEVIGNDSLIGGDPENVPVRARWWLADCCDHKTLLWHMKREKPDIVYNCAALAHEGLSVFSPSVIVNSIVGASTSVFSAAIACKVQRIVHCSSMARYGTGSPPFLEADPCLPQDPYGIAKVAAESILRNLCKVHSVEHVIAVPHNIIGPRQKYDDPFRNVASIMMNLMLQGRSPVIYGDGQQKRCFSYVDDCLSCLTKMAFDPSLDREVINIGPDEEPITILDLFHEIAYVTSFQGTPTFVPGRPQEVKLALCSSNKARRLLGYETKTSLREGLGRMCGYMECCGPKPFKYHLPIEINSPLTPKTWTERLF